MERKFVDVGHRVETQSDSGLPSDITRPTGNAGVDTTVAAELAKGSEAIQAALKKAAAAVGKGIQERGDEVITYARREPMTALTVAAGFGFVVGLVLAIGARAGTGDGGRAWLPRLNARRSLLGKRTGAGWRGFLRLE
jgi:hypothetical protein